MRDWFDISYLCKGTPRQRVAWETLTELGVFRHLAPFTPVLTGTIPIGLDLPGSDLDIVCRAEDLALFEEAVAGLYAHRLGFESKRRVWQGRASVVVNFDAGTFPVELFAQDRPVTEQNAYRHMRIDERLLRLGGDAARTAIMARANPA